MAPSAHGRTVRSVSVSQIVIPAAAGLLGVASAAYLARRNEKRARAERLLVEAMSDMVSAIAEVAVTRDPAAQARYASASSRIALHGSPAIVAAFRRFNDDATTATEEGRVRLLQAFTVARRDLGAGVADERDLAVLLFGGERSIRS